MDVLDDDVLLLWNALHKNDVAYILVGGFATNLHGFSRFTADVDIWLKDTLENRIKFKQALIEAGIGELENIETMEFVPGWTSIYLGSGIQLDLMTYLSGLPASSFDTCFDMSATVLIHDIPVRFLHKTHLIESKRASGRSKDLLDIEELEKLD